MKSAKEKAIKHIKWCIGTNGVLSTDVEEAIDIAIADTKKDIKQRMYKSVFIEHLTAKQQKELFGIIEEAQKKEFK